MNGYICFFKGKRIEITAASLYAAKLAAVAAFKAGKAAHLVSVTLAEVAGQTVTHTADF